MTIATGARSILGYIAEVTPGTTPATPQLKGVPYIGETLNLTRDAIADPSIRGDEMEHFHRSGNRLVGGNISVAHAPGTYDDFLEGIFRSTWATNVLKFGTTEKSFTFEAGSPDVTQFRSWTGVHMNQMTLNVPSGNSMVTAEYAVVGMNGGIAGATLDTSGGVDYTGAGANPFVHLDGVFEEGGASIAYFTGIQLTINRNLTANYALGSAGARAITAGMGQVAGQVTAYWESAAMYTKFINETASALKFTLTSSSKSQEWLVPNVIYTASNIPVSGDGPIIQTLSFKGLYDATTGTTVQITRTV